MRRGNEDQREARDPRQAIREMWRAEFTGGALEEAERLAETFALAWGKGEASEEDRLRAAMRDLAYARSYALHIENQETEAGLRRGECFYIVVAERIATELGRLLPAGPAAAPWREGGLREVFLPELLSPYRQSLASALELLHERSIEEASSIRRKAVAAERRAGGRPSVIGGMLQALGGELGFLSEYLRSLLLAEAARLSMTVEGLSAAAIQGAKERSHA